MTDQALRPATPRRSFPRRSMRLLPVIAVAAMLAGPGHEAAAFAPANTRCAAFSAGDVTYKVFRSRGVTCTTARRVMRQFWVGRKVQHHLDGMTDTAHTYYTLPGQPGWRCGTGAGDGTAGSAACSKRSVSARADGYRR